jgi:hypothetical protein
MGEIAEAARLMEQAIRINPENLSIATILAGFYGALGRHQEARAALELRGKAPGAPLDLVPAMYPIPLKDRAVSDLYAEGLRRAGLPPAKVSGGYFLAFKENQLTGEEIRRLLFGSKITGIYLSDGQQWWTDRKKNGEFTWRGPDPISSDSGMSRIDGDMICSQFQKRLWGVEFCATVFRNPKGTFESKNEYFFCSDMWFTPFSLAK